MLSWIYIAFTAINFGVTLEKWFKIDVRNLAVTAVFGLFLITLLTSVAAIFGRINIEFHLVLLVLNGVIWYWHRTELLRRYRDIIETLRDLSSPLKAMLLLISILILAQCSSAPYAVDNESYYIQTIKWLNEYGFVNGLANLHIFFGQTSGWHITQSAFTFSFAYGRFNDISGFCLLLGNIFAVIRLDQYFKGGAKSDLIIGLFPLANVLLFQFIGAPSPDIPIYVMTMMIVAYFLDSNRSDSFAIVSLLAIFAVFIKMTAIALVAFPLILLVGHFGLVKPILGRVVLLATVTAALFIGKNVIISGYVLFPAIFPDRLTPDWKVPIDVVRLYYTETKLFALRITDAQYETMSVWSLFKHWLFLPKLHGLFNSLSIALLIIAPWVIRKYYNIAKYWQLYGVMFFQMILLMVLSPQYRFFLNVIMLLSFIGIALLLTQRKWLVATLFAATVVSAVPLLLPMNLSALTKNNYADSNSVFSTRFIIEPHTNSKVATRFETVTEGNLRYNSPVNNEFFWGNYDGPLPCVNKAQLQYFESRFKVVPQMRSAEMADGFYAKPVRR